MSPEDQAIVITKFAASVGAWAKKYAPPGHDPQDVAQEVFRVFLERHDDIKPSRAAVFLHNTSLNVCMELRRKGARRARIAPEVPIDHAPDVADVEVDLDTTLVSAQMRPHLRDALDEVEPHRRRVVEAVVLDERTVTEIAAEDKVPASTVRHWYHTAIEDLRGILTRWRLQEQKASGGFTSWALMWAILDWRCRAVAWVARARALFTKVWPKLVAFAGAATGISGIVAAVTTLTGAAAPARVEPLPEELPAVAFEAPLLTFEPSVPRAPSSVEKAESAYTAPERPALGPRRRHDAHAHFEQQAFGDAAKRP